MKFREKTYFITLMLFLLFFNIGIFSLAYYTYQNNTKAAYSLCQEESRVIAEGFQKDSQYLNLASAQKILMRNYCEHYDDNNINLAFWNDEQKNVIYGNLGQDIKIPVSGAYITQTINDTRFFVISEPIENSNLLLIYAKNISYLDEDLKQLSVVYICASVVASVILAICLFLILRKLAKPLEKLRFATKEISNGNFNSRAPVSGKDEFSILAEDFNRMAEHIGNQMEELEAVAQTKQRMLDNLAHEMRTPLTSIRGYAEYLQNANISEAEKLEAIEYIISESERLKFIGERMLDEAFIRENQICPENVNISEMIFEITKKLSAKALSKGVALKSDTEEIYLSCDKLLTELLISNLADNAIKACGSDGVVVIGCKKENDTTVLSVCDNGRGMTSEQIAHITEPFYRTDKSRSRNEGGTGLGLSLCEKIALAHNAKLSFDSEPQKGTTAFVTFTNS